jgi:chemotaxis protein MotB
MFRRCSAMLLVATVSIAMLAGCSWTQRGAALGGAVGSGVGAIIGNNCGSQDTGSGALIGLGAGALAGALIGDLIDQQNMRALQAQLDKCKRELDAAKKQIAEQAAELERRQNRINELEREVAELRKKLDEAIRAAREGETIVLTMLGETLYAPGKAELTAQGRKALDEAMKVVREQFPDREIVVRGHTDDQPIRYSGWKSNWELGAARALGVLHYLQDKHGVKGEQISAQTMSLYRPVASNDTKEGRQQNRRAEIVILPKRPTRIDRPR